MASKAKKSKPQKKQGKKKGQGRFQDESKPKFVNKTPPGQLKDFSQEMESGYNPEKVEAAWDSWWEAQGLYKPDMDAKGDPFTIVIPPPNVTGSLHLGHALTCAIEDAITRRNRMLGMKVLWVPGTDHAGIATQVVVEKKLMRERKLSRHDLGREKFLEEVWKWKEKNGSRICTQLRRLGASVDWSRLVFTMDEKLSKAVTEAFVRTFDQGLLYRANRMVNWSCALQTAISSIEVEHADIKEPQKMRVPGYDEGVEVGWLTGFAYKFVDHEGEIVVATTRLETMLGDVAVAVHPDDPRYKDVIGRKLKHPFVEDREMVVIADDVLVDMSFGTGAVKITPGHDPNDFECGKRHSLKVINIFTESGCINENGGSFKGMKRYDARKVIEEKLKEMGLLREKTKNPMQIGMCSRSGDLIEPVVRPQWWVSCKGMAEKAVAAVRNGDLQIMPKAFDKVWYHWLENIQDWCVSRQLWWGHRIPAYFVHIEGEEKTVTQDCDTNRWIVARSKEDAMKEANKKFKGKKFTLKQDEDVLDTWFSSGLFPFSVMGWPEETDDFKTFYPNNLLETGHDILFFWVARMVMQGIQLTGKLPYTKVYLHPMVRDKAGRKMSKSLGNVVDPINVMEGITLEALHEKLKSGNLDPREVKKAIQGQKESFPDGIAQCGSDALRFGLLAYTSQGRNINLDIQRVVAYRQFANKLWNATKFTLMNLGSDFQPPVSTKEVDNLVNKTNKLFNRWIMSRLSYAIKNIDDAFEAYEFGDATTAIYNFWLSDLCDNYLEMIKPAMRADMNDEKNALNKRIIQNVLYICLDHGLKLIHPFMPFLSEELYHRLPGHTAVTQRIKKEAPKSQQASGSIMVQPYPIPSQNNWRDESVENAMELVSKIAHTARSSRSSLGLTKERVQMFVLCTKEDLYSIVSDNTDAICTLSFAGNVTAIKKTGDGQKTCISAVANEYITIFLETKGLDLSKELTKLGKQMLQFGKLAKGLRAKMEGSAYAAKTKESIKKEHQEKLDGYEKKLSGINDAIERLHTMMPREAVKAYWTKKVEEEEAKTTKLQAQADKMRESLPPNKKKLPKKLVKIENNLENVKESIICMKKVLADAISKAQQSEKVKKVSAPKRSVDIGKKKKKKKIGPQTLRKSV